MASPVPALDPLAILTELGLTGVTALAPVSGGRDTAIWRVETGATAFALRVFRAEQAAAAEREAAALRAAASGGIPVPRVHALGRWRDRPAMLLGWCDGHPLVAELQARPWRLWPLGVAFGQMQARIHAAPAPDLLRSRPDAWLAWAGPVETALQARLRELAPAATALLHLDYHPLNVLTDGQQITAVLDWVNAAAGDPRADLARTASILRLEMVGAGLAGLAITAAARLLEWGWRYGYRQVAGRPPNLAPFYAWAGAVMARDRAPRPGRGGMSPQQLARVRTWTDMWKQRAGVPAADT